MKKTKLGKQVWNRLAESAELYATNDKDSLKIFKEMVKKLPVKDAVALKAYLQYEIHDLEYNFSEFATAREENLEQELKNTYKTYLSALQSVMR